MVINCADGKRCLWFLILLASIMGHAEQMTLHGIGSMSGPKCEVQCNELDGNQREVSKVHYYAIYEEKAGQYESGEGASTQEYFWQVGVKIVRKVFTRLYRVNPSDPHKLHLLHNISLGLFKHMMQWVAGFLKKYKCQ